MRNIQMLGFQLTTRKCMHKNILTNTYCYKCNNKTKQLIEFERSNFDTNAIYAAEKNEEIGWVVQKTDYILSSCKGGDSYNLQIKTSHSGPNGIDREVSNEHLPAKPKKRVEPWIFRLSSQYIELLSEIYSSFNNSNYRLAMMGLRALIDIFIVENIGDKGTFKQKLKLLKEQNFVSEGQFEMLDTSIEAGNAAAHRGFKPSEKALISVIEVVEHLLKPMALQTNVNKLKNEVPQRKKT